MLSLDETIEEVETDKKFIELFIGTGLQHIQIKVNDEELEWREMALFYLKRYKELISRIKEV